MRRPDLWCSASWSDPRWQTSGPAYSRALAGTESTWQNPQLWTLTEKLTWTSGTSVPQHLKLPSHSIPTYSSDSANIFWKHKIFSVAFSCCIFITFKESKVGYNRRPGLNAGIKLWTDDFLLQSLVIETLVVLVYGRRVSLQEPGVRLIRVWPAVVVRGVLGTGPGQRRQVRRVLGELDHRQPPAVLLLLLHLSNSLQHRLGISPAFYSRATVFFVRQWSFLGLLEKSWLLNPRGRGLPLLILDIPGVISCGRRDPVRIVDVDSVRS